MDDPQAPEAPPEATPPPNPPDVASLPLAPPANSAHNLFIGPDGLRAGWRFTLYLLMGAVIAAVLILAMRALSHHVALKLWGMMLAEFLILVAAIVPAIVMSRIEKRPFGDYGLPPASAFGKQFWVGVVWGLVWLTVLMLGMASVKAFHISGLALSGVRILKFAAFYGLFFLIVGFFEEFLLRGYTQFTLTLGMGFWPSATLLSLLFGAIHLGNQGEAWTGALAAALIGFFFCLTLRRTGNLWFAVGFHASWDWGETYLFSVPNSGNAMPGHLVNASFHGSHWLTGGTVGPEGSVLIFVMIAAMWIVFDRRYPDVKYRP